MNIKGKLYDGKTSASCDVEVRLSADGVLQLAGQDRAGQAFAHDYPLRAVRISERVGNTQRRLSFSDGAMCEIADNDALDDWLTEQDAHSFEHRVFRLEGHWRIAVAALVATLLIAWLAIRYGVPAAADYAARIIPPAVDARIGSEGLALLDKTLFDPSTLTTERQQAIRADFERIVGEVNDVHRFRLEFRRSPRVGANAFALPSGIVVMTDELVELAGDPREITAVLAHEIGHVVHRHSLRSIIRNSASAALMVALLGDFTSISSAIAATPVVLVQAKYSREFETEADDFSYAWLDAHGVPRHFLGDMLVKLEDAHDRKKEKGEDSSDSDFDFFSSHPRTRDRIRE